MSLSRFRGRIAVTVMVVAFALVITSSSAYAALTQAQTDAVVALLNSFGVDQATVNNVKATLTGQPTTPTTPSTGNCGFTRSLSLGSTGTDVLCLQQYLNGAGYTVAASGVGSAGSETTYYGSLTQSAVAKWQAANGVSPAAGYFGPISQAKYNSLVAAAPTTPTTPTTPAPTVPTGTAIAVAKAGTQPVASIAPQSAARVPFTKFTLTASADGDITVKSVTIQRVGLMADTSFGGVILLDENGNQIGLERTLNSTHQAVLTSDFTVPKGTTKTYTIAGNMATDLSQETGQVGGLDIIAVNAGSATVSGGLPISGTQHTANSSLTIGVVTVALGANDPGSANATLEVGRTGYIAAGLQFTIGSAEDVQLEAVRWNQAGSASKDDLKNVVINIDGTNYPAVITEDGKYFRANLATPLKMIKGAVIQLYVKVDVDSGSGRTVDFNMDRKTDIVVKGLSFGHYLTPGGGSSGSADPGALSSDTQPFFNAYAHTISNGTITVSKAVQIPSQNIAVNLGGQVLGGFSVEVKGEPINVSAMNFDLSLYRASGTGGDSLETNDITSITLEGANGNVVAGPVDGTAGGNNGIQFTDTITFPVGTNIYTLKGKIGTDAASNDTVAASTTPTSDWTSKGQVTGNDITESPGTAVTGSTMTVRAADLRVSINTTPPAQNMVAGSKGFHFANVVLDSTSSGEDVRVTTIKPALTIATANTGDDLSGCQLWNGDTAINTGSNAVDVGNSVASDADVTFTIDSPGLIVSKGTVKTLALKCNVRANTDGVAGTATYAWGLNNTAGNVVSTGVTSAQAVTEVLVAATGQAMTLRAGGSLAVVLDASSPSLKWVQAGATDQTVAVLRVNATYEDVRLDSIGLQLATSTTAADSMASNTPSDVSKVSLWNGSKKIGEATFTSTDYATSTFTTAFGATQPDFTVAKDSQMLLTVKADVGNIGTVTDAFPGHLLVINYDASWNDGADTTSTNRGLKGTGINSGNTIWGAGTDTAANGTRIAKATPTVARVPLTSTKFSNLSGQNLYQFKVTAPAGTNGLSLYKFTFSVATSVSGYLQELPGGGNQDPGVSTFRVDTYQVYCYDDANFSSPSCGSTDNSGLLYGGGIADFSTIASTSAGSNEQIVSVRFNPTSLTNSTAEAITIPAGGIRYFKLTASVTGASSTPSIVVKMQGDATFAGLNDSTSLGDADTQGGDQTTKGDSFTNGRYVFATTAANVDAWDDDDFIWAGNSTSTASSINTYDWFNGFLVPGLSNTDSGVSETLTLTQ